MNPDEIKQLRQLAAEKGFLPLEHKLNQADKMTGLDTPDGTQPRGCLSAQGHRDDGPSATVPSQAPSAGLPVRAPAKPEFSPEILRNFAQRWRPFVDTAWLADRSPIAPHTSTGGLSADDYLRAVFREGESVVLFTNHQSQGQAMWPLQKAPTGGDDGVWYLAQPVDGFEYVNPRSKKDGGGEKMSRRSEESVTDWRHLVLESDEADARDWLGALVQLPLRIVAIYTSGGRSIHALVRIDARTKGNWDGIVKQIRPSLVTLGADPRAMSAVRLTRLPGCLRGTRLQKLLFLNPEPTTAPICTLPVLRHTLAQWENAAAALMKFTAAEIRAEDAGEEIERLKSALEWFESAPAARPLLARVREWEDAR